MTELCPELPVMDRHGLHWLLLTVPDPAEYVRAAWRIKGSAAQPEWVVEGGSTVSTGLNPSYKSCPICKERLTSELLMGGRAPAACL